jgi:hypothetical protein
MLPPADNSSGRLPRGPASNGTPLGKPMPKHVNVLALLKDGERYVFLYDDQSLPQLLQTLGRYAADPELSFSWYDAAVLSQKVRRLQQSGETGTLFRDAA